MSKTYLIDTNIFLEFMLSQSKSSECKRLLTMLRDKKVEGAIISLDKDLDNLKIPRKEPAQIIKTQKSKRTRRTHIWILNISHLDF